MNDSAALNQCRKYLTDMTVKLGLSKYDITVGGLMDLLEYFQRNPEKYEEAIREVIHY